MTTKRITLAYCSDNQHVAKEVDRNLSRVDYEFEHISCSQGKTEETISGKLRQSNYPIILLISDNFLKSATCMYDLLTTVQDLIRTGRIKPVIIDGVYRNEKGVVQTVPTAFDRVSNVIQYMNYWQDKYLEVRREKRQAPESDEAVLNERLKVIRSISSEIGEFLRFLRNMDYTTYQQFKANDYEHFFRFTDDTPAHTSFQSLPHEDYEIEDDFVPSSPSASTPPQLEEEEEEEPILTDVEDEPEQEDDLEEEFDISAIPGMDLISNGVEEEHEEDEETDTLLEETEFTIGEHQPSQESDDMPILQEEAEEIENAETPVSESSEEEEQKEEDEVTGSSSSTVVHENQKDWEEDEEDEDWEEDDDDWEEDEETDDVSEKEILEEVQELLKADETDDALEMLKHATEEHPGMTNLRYEYAVALIQYEQRFEEAKSQLEILLNYNPEYEEAYFLLGELAEHRQDYMLAKSYYEKVLSLNNEYEGANYRLGLLLLNHFEGEERKAAKHLKRAVKNDEENVDAHYQYAILLDEHVGKHWKAIKYFKKVLKLQPNHPFANYDLAVIYHRLGDKYKAFKHYQRAIQINPEVRTEQNDKAFEYELIDEPEETDMLTEVNDNRIEELQKDIRRLEQLILKHEELTNTSQQTSELPAEAAFPPKKDKTIFITGATSGIGRATAELFAENGYRLILNGRREERLQYMKEEYVEKYQADVHLLPFDVRDVKAVQAAIDSLQDEWRQVDILLNNAGLASGLAPIHEGDLEDWEKMIDTNVKGLLYMTRAISPYMVERQEGHIINICSTAGKEVYPKGNVYNASKFAVDALTKAMRIDLHSYNIRVSQVAPGHVEETEFAKVRFHGDEQKAKIYEDFQPLKAKDVAEVIYFIVTRPTHVNIQDVLMMGTQQASNIFIDRSGREE